MRTPIVLSTMILVAASAAAAADGTGGLPHVLDAGDLPPIVPGEEDGYFPGQDPGDSVEAGSWSDWTGGETFTRLSRVNLVASLGMAQPTGGPLSGRWESGPGISLDAGWAFAPFLVVGLSMDYSLIDGSDGGITHMGTPIDYQTSGVTMLMGGLELKLRVPFNLIGPALFRFSKAREGLGLVPGIRLGFGFARVSKATVDYWESGVWYNRTVFEQYGGAYFDFGLDVEIRWRGFGIGLSFSMFEVSGPDILFGRELLAMPEGGMKHQFVSLSFGAYF